MFKANHVTVLLLGAAALLLTSFIMSVCHPHHHYYGPYDYDAGDAGEDTIRYVERDASTDSAAADIADTGEDVADIREEDAGDAAPLDGGDALPDTDIEPDANGEPPAPKLGVRREEGVTRVAVRSLNATRVEAWFYEAPTDVSEVARVVLEPGDLGVWTAETAGLDALYYGLRVWGPNWPYADGWAPGSELGFLADVDATGNRFNPNKLLIDPYALELSHDPLTPAFDDSSAYRSGPEYRAIDTAPFAPKGVVIPVVATTARPTGPARALRDDVIYEVHVRGLTQNDPSVPEELRGTFAGAALKAGYLADLGVSAIELLPLHETQNARNDVEEGTDGDNYWGYASLSFFAPDRRYAFDQSPGGPTRELRAMVDAFHAVGIKVFVDVVYNHTGEGGSWGDDREYANLYSWRGVDNASWYHVVEGSRYRNDNGVGPNLRFTTGLVRDMVADSIRYWSEHIGVDGFRFDLASVLGNRCEADCFEYDPTGLLTELSDAFARSEDGATGVDLIAEPWGATAGTYQVGNYPAGWHEWNDRYRIAIRSAMNEPWAPPTPAELAMRIHGSSDLYRDDGRGPDAGIGYVVSHDGFPWFDVFQCADRDNNQPWPFGPSDGGSAVNRSADYDGDPVRQRQAARTAFAVLAMSAPPPMLTGGDEFLRSQYCNNNAYNLDSVANWLDWEAASDEAERHTLFVRRMLRLRRLHPALRPASWTEGGDGDGDGVPDIAWYDQTGSPPAEGFWDDAYAPIIGWRIDADEALAQPRSTLADETRSILVFWNRGEEQLRVPLPTPQEGLSWWRMADTAAWLEGDANSHAFDNPPEMPAPHYDLHGGSVGIWIER